MFIPIWFLIAIVVLGTLHLIARVYIHRKFSKITTEKFAKHINTFYIRFKLLNKEGRFYTNDEKRAILEYPINKEIDSKTETTSKTEIE